MLKFKVRGNNEEILFTSLEATYLQEIKSYPTFL